MNRHVSELWKHVQSTRRLGRCPCFDSCLRFSSVSLSEAISRVRREKVFWAEAMLWSILPEFLRKSSSVLKLQDVAWIARTLGLTIRTSTNAAVHKKIRELGTRSEMNAVHTYSSRELHLHFTWIPNMPFYWTAPPPPPPPNDIGPNPKPISISGMSGAWPGDGDNRLRQST